ncbi:MAG TPA: hypothetical protein VG871_17465 [Vicinamibacterales bacterium]|nr:hypothetical protein [Vicinamibacterales bacterium]
MTEVFATRPLNLLFIVCHPDDEALWIGGLLCELPQFQRIRTFVICLSGRDPESSRPREFEEARRVAGYHRGVVLGQALRPVGHPLPPISGTTEEGLGEIGLRPDAVDLLVTHSPYGDEHANPHHMQAYRELRTWTAALQIPFGYFSYVPMADLMHIPVDTGFRRAGGLHLVSRSRCEWPARSSRTDVRCPREYVQFAVDAQRKHEMFRSYDSIGVAEHERHYAALTSATEGVYIEDPSGSRVVDAIVEGMVTPSLNDGIGARYAPAPPTLTRRVAGKLRRLSRP